jgi:hypothetical protein
MSDFFDFLIVFHKNGRLWTRLKAETMTDNAGDNSMAFARLEWPETIDSGVFWAKMDGFSTFLQFSVKLAGSGRVLKPVMMVLCIEDPICGCVSKIGAQ